MTEMVNGLAKLRGQSFPHLSWDALKAELGKSGAKTAVVQVARRVGINAAR